MSTTEGEQDAEVSCDLEDGELEDSDLEVGTYKPLERPDNFNPTSIMNMQIVDDHSDESVQESSGSDSDSVSLSNRPKKSKAKMRRLTSSEKDALNKKKKYNVWCSALQEDILTETMTSCDVTRTRELGVESYDYTIKYRLDSNNGKNVFTANNDHNKRRYCDRKSAKLRLGKRLNPSADEDLPSTHSYELPDLRCGCADSVADVAENIATNLKEENPALVLKIVETLGVNKSVELYRAVQRIEADGGLLIMNGKRRRTPGGVFIHTLKKDPEVTAEMRKIIFKDEKQNAKRERRRAFPMDRELKVQQLKESLNDTDLGARPTVAPVPPPSPVTDCRDSDTDPNHQNSEPNRTVSANNDSDDFLDLHCSQDMDLF